MMGELGGVSQFERAVAFVLRNRTTRHCLGEEHPDSHAVSVFEKNR
jgi:hypothetical protein